jgi:hypothetical protein
MISAGIDEAGYGPLLGPLVVGCCAFELTDGDPRADELPCLWKRLRKLVSKNRTKAGKKLHVNDSKQVYSPSTGIKNWSARSSRSSRRCARIRATNSTRCSLVLQVTPCPICAAIRGISPTLAKRFPLEQDLTPIRLFANALKTEMDKRLAMRAPRRSRRAGTTVQPDGRRHAQ